MRMNWKAGALALLALSSALTGAACESAEKASTSDVATEVMATAPPTTPTTAAPTTTSTSTTPPTTAAPTTTAPPPPPPPTTTQAPRYDPPAAPQNKCDPNYTGCVPIASDVDCAGGSGNGPAYTGHVRVIGSDIYDLDRDGNGEACE